MLKRLLLILSMLPGLQGADALVGPPALAIKGIQRCSAQPYWVSSGGMKAILRDVPGAVVVVEDSLPVFLVKVPPSMNLVGGKLKLKTHQDPLLTRDVQTMAWMDPNAIRFGGNVIQRLYPLGGVSF